MYMAESLCCVPESFTTLLIDYIRECLENPRDGGACWATIYGVAESQTWLKQLNSSSSRQTRCPLPMWGFSIKEIHGIWVWIFTFPMDLEFLGSCCIHCSTGHNDKNDQILPRIYILTLSTTGKRQVRQQEHIPMKTNHLPKVTSATSKIGPN